MGARALRPQGLFTGRRLISFSLALCTTFDVAAVAIQPRRGNAVRSTYLIPALLLISISAAPAAADGLYVQGDLGIDYYPPNDLDGSGFDIEPGLSLGGRIGTDFSFFRGELEGGLAISTIDLAADAGDDDADYYQVSIAAGVYKDVGPVYFGAGAGFVYQEIESQILGVTVSNDETNFIAHAEAGITIGITDSIAIVPHYRATWLPGFNLDEEVIVHSARLGIRFGI